MSSTSGLKIVFGGGGISKGRSYEDVESLHKLFAVLKKHGCTNIDTAQLYGESEELLGQANAADGFTLDTKWKGGFGDGGMTKENILKTADESMSRLKTGKVDIFYIHAPDHSTPLDETLSAVNEVHQKGYFHRFGLSNYRAEDVQTIYNHCKEHNYVLPTAYQGNYSPVARLQDTVLFPTLRKLKISFYAYSPLAGGFLVKSKQQILDGAGRFGADNMGGMYRSMYNKPAYLEALAEWEDIAKEAGISKADLAYRWVSYNSPLKKEQGDAIIVGASKLGQLEETLEGLKKGPLSEGVCKRIDDVWKKIEHEAPLDNYHDTVGKAGKPPAS